jgi:hypothetical protein
MGCMEGRRKRKGGIKQSTNVVQHERMNATKELHLKSFFDVIFFLAWLGLACALPPK